jgi:uncharacterized protein
MLLKLLIFAVVGVMIYRFFGGKVPILDSVKKPTSKPAKKEKEEAMVECSKCGTYVTIEESILISGKYYCDECA